MSLHLTDLDTPPDDFLSGEPEGAAFHKAFLAANVPGFQCRYFSVSRDGARIAIVPYFLSTFSATELLPDGLIKKAFSWIGIGYACVGHPCTDFGAIDGEVSAEVLDIVNAKLYEKSRLVAYKGFSDLPLRGYTRARGLPVSVLNIAGDYFSTLDSRRRNDFRHKLEKAQALKIEEYSPLPDHLVGDVYRLYMNTYNRAPTRFERLTPEYFRQTARISKYLVFFEADKPIGFAQIIGKGGKACFAYVGMDYDRNRQYGLYYVMCIKGIEACIKSGHRQMELGVTSYHFKHLLGAKLVETSLYYRHSSRAINWLIGKCKFLLEPEVDELA